MSSEYISEWMFSMATAKTQTRSGGKIISARVRLQLAWYRVLGWEDRSASIAASCKARCSCRVGGWCASMGLTLEAVEAARLRDLDLGGEVAREVLEHDAIGRGEEGEDVLDEVALVVAELLPVRQVLAEVNLLHGPEACLHAAGGAGSARTGKGQRRGAQKLVTPVDGAEGGQGWEAPRASCTSPTPAGT